VRRLPPVAAGEFWNLAYVRLHRIADAILSRQEHHYHYRPPRQSDIDERVRGLCATILGRLETRYLGQIQCGDFFDRSRHLMAMLKDDDSPQHQKDALDARFAWALSTFYAGYLSPDSPPERFAETVMKLQRELKHRVPISFRADRTAVVDVGRPLDVASYITPHHLHDGAARRLAADAILADLGGALREMVQTLQQQPFRGSGVGARWSGVRGPDIACEGDRHRSNAWNSRSPTPDPRPPALRVPGPERLRSVSLAFTCSVTSTPPIPGKAVSRPHPRSPIPGPRSPENHR